MKRIADEKGGVLFETLMAISLLALFLAGVVRNSEAQERRFRRIVAHRNQTIRELRTLEAPKPLDLLRLDRTADIGVDGAR